MATFHIHLEGQVQGVGFRPLVCRLAQQANLKGWVSNGKDGLHISVSGPEKKVHEYYNQILSQPPQNSIITNTSIVEEIERSYEDFRIIESQITGAINLMITPDLGICPDCKSELHESSNSRFEYAFITCLNCGPRYSIMKGLPYDRPLTTMKKFSMCETCQTEYGDPMNRRFYAQTNSCPQCAVQLSWLDSNDQLLLSDQKKVIEAAIQSLSREKIVAVKGIGGYLLIADSTSPWALSNLRKRKARPSKPFALLYADESMLKKDVHVEATSLSAWKSIESPIVLFKLKSNPKSGLQTELIAPGLDRIGVMQPYAPILELIASKFKKPLVATSGNISGYPIFYDDEKAISALREVADNFLSNNRKIVIPQDDSVQIFSQKYQQKIVLRRSRGYAPNFHIDNLQVKTQTRILTMGALLKSTFTIQNKRNIYISQYLGNTINYDVQLSYKTVLKHIMNLLEFKPEHIVIDKHPAYFSCDLGLKMSTEFDAPIIVVQHHKAHFAAVLAENHLLDCQDSVLGVIWDGTGYGDDGNIWGGEFFVYQNLQIKRTAHFEYFNHFLGDKMSKEPRLSALSIAHTITGSKKYLKPKFTDNEWKLYQKQFIKASPLKTSSMGRLFDAVASLLDICDIQTYEGEAAMRLQVLAEQYLNDHAEIKTHYFNDTLSSQIIFQSIIQDLNSEVPKEQIAAKFHLTLVKRIANQAKKLNLRKIAFSGGCFQNSLLVDLILSELKNDYELYFHKQLSPNDENISFGQLVYAGLQLNKK